MHIRLPDVDENFIKHKVNSGFYTSENEAVRDAVRRMREDEERLHRFQAAIALGDADIAAGRTEPLTSELVANMRRSAVKRTQTDGTPLDPDVIP